VYRSDRLPHHSPLHAEALQPAAVEALDPARRLRDSARASVSGLGAQSGWAVRLTMDWLLSAEYIHLKYASHGCSYVDFALLHS